MTPYILLADAVNSVLKAQPYQMQYYLLHVNLTNTSCYEALAINKRLMAYPDLIRYITLPLNANRMQKLMLSMLKT